MDDLPKALFAFPGPLRDQLIEAILTGAKTSTTSLVVEYEHDGEPLPAVGARSVLVDSADQPVAIIETTEVRVMPLRDIDLAHAIDEGEGYTSVAEWRAGHETFWLSAEMRDYLGYPDFRVTDDTMAVAERFRLVERW
ncbi:MAG: ASCH domain-containing protein [Sporichthyaceae bacterium]|nr:ASCH domain-containing protein [Sporichthyaceae bacterium]